VYIELFKEICDTFSWSYEKILGIDPRIVEQKIRTYLDAKFVRKNLRPINPQKVATIKVEVKNLIKDGFVYPVQLTEWWQTMFLSIKIKVQFKCHCCVF
jgi:hypothetical protein